MLDWYSRRIPQVSMSVSDMLTPIMHETLTKAGLQRGMCLHCLKHRWVGALFYSLPLHFLLQRVSTWPWRRLWRRKFGFKGCSDDLGIEHDLLKINCDSMSAIYLAKNQVYHARKKHIDVRFHFVQEILDEGYIELLKIHPKENLADMLTNVVSGVKFTHCKELLHILAVAWACWSSFGWTTNDLIP